MKGKISKPAVAVVGGGIAGIQASIELANSGFHVYLIEKDVSIGGNMAKLDKTFPTNDCSTCMISPKFLELNAHPDIEIFARSEVLDLKGEPGKFILRIRKLPRFIDEDLCTACGQCAEVCPIEIPDTFNQGLSIRRATYKHFPQAIPPAYAIDKAGTAPCKAACPSGISIEGFIALIRKGLYREAVKLIKRDNPFPGVCGRICPHPCETACYRGRQDDPVAIEKLKRFVADLDLFSSDPYIPEKKPPKGKRVAVIGAGPAGLTAAYYLAVEGYDVVVFEALEKPGGLLQYGIPPFRLDREVVRREIEIVERLGVVFKTNTTWGRDFTLHQLRQEGFDAIFIGIGAWKPIPLNIPGENLQNVYAGIHFLKAVSCGNPPEVGKRVAIIGGGSVALDAAMTARRLGVEEVIILYRRSRVEMPVVWEDLEEVEEEGIHIEYLTGCVEILGDERGRVCGVKCIRMELGPPDESGRRRPIPIEGSFFELEVDTVIAAVGQRVEFPMLQLEPPDTRLRLDKWGTIWVNPKTYETSVPGIFAAGDAVFGPATVVLAIGSAKEAAISIDGLLQGKDLVEGRDYFLPVPEKPFRVKPSKRRIGYSKIPLEERINSFKEVFLGFSEEEAQKEAQRCLECGICSECYRCEEACLVNAVKHRMRPEEIDLPVVGVVLAPGFKPFDPSIKQEYGYGRYANVVTSLEFERMLAASGPTGGELRCPKDGSHPKKIAWIQCVGSRDASIGRDYCSSVCCMYAMKQAMVAKDHDPTLETTIFFIDVRAMGKGFERYYERAKNQYGVKFVKSSISRIVEVPKGGKIEVSYVDESDKIITEIFDLVVLSVGVVPDLELSERLGLRRDSYGFIQSDPFDSVQTGHKGVVVCGMAEGPRDIPDSVVQACSAASSLQEFARTEGEDEREFTSSTEVRADELDKPRIGVFVCHCGTNIAGVVDVKTLSQYARTLSDVIVAEDLLFACASDGTRRIKEMIEEYNLNRIVVASCSPRTHEPLFRNIIREAGINKYLFEMANIRDQCSWVHRDNPGKATEKAKNLVRMAVAKARLLEPLKELRIPLCQSVVVVGGGPSGMVSALQLARQDYQVTIVEKTSALGGNASKWHYIHHSGASVQNYVKSLIDEVMNTSSIRVVSEAEVVKCEGRPGAFMVTLQKRGNEGQEILTAGAIIIATGAKEYGGDDFLRGKAPQVLSQREFQKAMAMSDPILEGVRRIVMIQCVGSRNESHPYCSRICCTTAVANAISYKEMYPDAQITVLYRDIRTFGVKELLYAKARAMGIRFLRFDERRPPQVVEEDPDRRGSNIFRVRYDDPVLRKSIWIPVDLIVLSTGVVPPEENGRLSKIFKLNLDSDGFLMEAHMKLRPIDTATPGIFICGLAQGPKFLEECIAQAKGAASRVAVFLKQKFMTVGGVIAVVNSKRCARCLTCVRTCPYGAPSITESRSGAFVDPAVCQGCGACVAVCPGKAIELKLFTDEQTVAKITAFTEDFRL
ncbi:MAG: FAD-dependent oxidoreductase [Syntrophobacterales bacterium]|nr:FAD-dependent oxidoreductase [Syntrophobacterales bacterium]